jgi:hypothetical protein
MCRGCERPKQVNPIDRMVGFLAGQCCETRGEVAGHVRDAGQVGMCVTLGRNECGCVSDAIALDRCSACDGESTSSSSISLFQTLCWSYARTHAGTLARGSTHAHTRAHTRLYPRAHTIEARTWPNVGSRMCPGVVHHRLTTWSPAASADSRDALCSALAPTSPHWQRSPDRLLWRQRSKLAAVSATCHVCNPHHTSQQHDNTQHNRKAPQQSQNIPHHAKAPYSHSVSTHVRDVSNGDSNLVECGS